MCTRRPVLSVHSMYCRSCAQIVFRMKARRFPPEAEEGVREYVRQHDYQCYYTDLPLEMDDTKSAWFCTFDHWIPLDPRKIVLCCAWVNAMKSALSDKEFWFYIFQLNDCHLKHTPVKKIGLAYWHRRFGAKTPEVFRPIPRTKGPVLPKKCWICGKPVFKANAKYCLRCSHFVKRMYFKRFPPSVVKKILEYVRVHGFVCYYTGMPLNLDNHRSPWYAVFDYLTPGDKSKVVLTSALFCEMKSDLAIDEFWYYIRQLANYKRNGTPIRKRKLVYWYRLTLKEKLARPQ